MFTIAHESGGATYWAAADGSSTYYVGQIVTAIAASKAAIAGTCKPLAVPAGAADATNFQVPLGIVTGLNKRYPTYNGTYGNYDTGVTTQAALLAREWVGAEGMYVKSDPQVMIQITEILPTTYIKGAIYNAAHGTAPTVVTDTGGTDSTGYTSAGTTGACDFTPVANVATIYCRSGSNQGLYRVTSDTSTTAPAVTVAFPYDVALGDTFVRVPMKQGLCSIYINGSGTYVDCAQLDASNHFDVIVKSLDLREAGKETVTFRFAADHFSYARA